MKKVMALLMSMTVFYLTLGVAFAAENAVLTSTLTNAPMSSEDLRKAELKMDKQERKKVTREKAQAAKINAVSRMTYMKTNPLSRLKSMDIKTQKMAPAGN